MKNSSSSEPSGEMGGPEYAQEGPGPVTDVGQMDNIVFRSAQGLDDVIGQEYFSEEAIRSAAMRLKEAYGAEIVDRPPLITWPRSLYIPAQADWKSHWYAPPPADHLYARDWGHATNGVVSASKDTGELYSFHAARTTDRLLGAEAGLGILFTPKHTLSLISFEPEIDCWSTHRLKSMLPLDKPSAGYVSVRGEIILAAWQLNLATGSFDPVANFTRRRETMFDDYMALSGIRPIIRKRHRLTGEHTATRVLVEAERTYLLGVVASVTLDLNVTDNYGEPYPQPGDGSFRAWGALNCHVPQIAMREETVYVP
jgi:hypothetical protein